MSVHLVIVTGYRPVKTLQTLLANSIRHGWDMKTWCILALCWVSLQVVGCRFVICLQLPTTPSTVSVFYPIMLDVFGQHCWEHLICTYLKEVVSLATKFRTAFSVSKDVHDIVYFIRN